MCAARNRAMMYIRAKKFLIGLALFVGVMFVSLAVGFIRIGAWSGPGEFNDGRNHQVIEVTVFNQIGYTFGTRSGGWFRPSKTFRDAQ